MPRERIETEAEVAAELSRLRQIASVYANPDIDLSDVPATWSKLKTLWWSHAYKRQHAQWDFATFLCSQLSDDEITNVSRVVFRAERTWYRMEASEECRKRFDAVKSNLRYEPLEKVFLVFGPAIAKSWTSLKLINSLANCKDRPKRKTDSEIRAAINAAAASRHADSDDVETVVPEWTPEDVDAAFKVLRPGEEPGRASRRSTPALSSRPATPVPSAQGLPPAPVSEYGTPMQPPSLGPARDALSGLARDSSPFASSPLAAPPRTVFSPVMRRKRPREDLTYKPPVSKRARLAVSVDDDEEEEEEEEEEQEQEKPEDPRGLDEDYDQGFGASFADNDEAGAGSSRDSRKRESKGKGKQVASDIFTSDAEEEKGDNDNDDIQLVEAWGKMAEAVLALPVPKGKVSKDSLYVAMIQSFKAAAKVTSRATRNILIREEDAA
ncbi:hypothetical protein K4K61_002130 [Colletotrichum sp. SAR11_59]|nr:hypothetical protein K4K61_002130 [Colletotrichum sp. SAR11_59]